MMIRMIMVTISLGILGVTMGSFAGAQVWRLRARQLQEDKKAGEKVDGKELKKLTPLTKKKLTKDRSLCLECGHELRWYDLLPLVSWLMLRGRCRYCKKFIGWTELLLEIGLGLLFSLSLMFWLADITQPWQVVSLSIWLTGLTLLAILFVYDLRWQLLPDVINVPFIILGAMFAAVQLSLSSDITAHAWSLAGSLATLSGVYALLYLFSYIRYGEERTWVGFGDVKLCLGLALFLGDWLLAFATLFAANFIGTLLVLPPMLMGKLKANARIAFGPLLIVGFLVAWFCRQAIFDWCYFFI